MLVEKFLISVIVPTYNRSKYLSYTLKSLVDQNLDPSNFEVVIVDDGSSDDTFEMIKKFESLINIKYAYQADRGYRAASARNLGIKAASGDICMFIDSGILVKSNCLSQHIKTHTESAEELAVIGYTFGYTQQGESESELLDSLNPQNADWSIENLIKIRKFWDIREPLYQKYQDKIEDLSVPWTLFWGGHLSVKRNDLFEVGLFDEKYDGNWGCEDNDLGYRLFHANKKLVFCREAAVLHLPHSSEHESKELEGFENCKYFNSKFNTVETQLFLEYYIKEISGQYEEHEVVDFHALLLKEHKPSKMKNNLLK